MKWSWWLLSVAFPMSALAAPVGLGSNDSLTRAEAINPVVLAPQTAFAAPEPGTPLYIARAVEFRASSETTGVWDQLPDRRWVWRAVIHARDALSVGVTLDASPALGRSTGHVYSPQGSSIYPLRTQTQERVHSPLVGGDTLILEIVTAAADSHPRFTISRLDYGFSDPAKPSTQHKSGSCNVDTVCPEGDAWRDEIRSVASYAASSGAGTFSCTGTLLANTSGDGRPLFLTANHCISSESLANSMTLYWNFETSTCGGTPNGSRTDSQSGASLLAASATTDFALVELDARPNTAFDTYYSGWNATSSAPTQGTAIHHPMGDEKAISFEYAAPASTNYGSTGATAAGTHWRIVDWDVGTTEQGSSGSALWDQNKRIIGQLEGGGAACGNDESDWYGKLAVSWSNDGSNPCSSLSPHLDPNGTGTPTSIAGYDLNAAGGTTLPLSDACYRADGGGDNGGAIGGGSSGSLLLTWLAPLLLAGWWRRRRGLRGKH